MVIKTNLTNYDLSFYLNLKKMFIIELYDLFIS